MATRIGRSTTVIESSTADSKDPNTLSKDNGQTALNELSSVPLQILFFLNVVYFVFYFLATLLMIIYKSQVLSYPDGNLAVDLVLLFIMIFVEAIRLYLGSKGNLREEKVPMGISLALTCGSVMLSVYFLVWQTYVLRADIIINAILLIIYCLESVLDIIAIAAFASAYA